MCKIILFIEENILTEGSDYILVTPNKFSSSYFSVFLKLYLISMDGF